MFSKIQGNARGCLIYEPLFILPWSMLSMYVSVYMLDLGVGEEQIGLITSIGLVLQLIMSFVSGYLTDRMGRKRALFWFDLISWSLSGLVWAISQNIWFFLIAAVCNSFQRVPTTAWYCLLVEDTDAKDRSIVFRVLQLIGVVGGLFAPLGGLLVAHFSVVPAMRILYVIFAISVTVMNFTRNTATHETEIGLRKRQESQSLELKSTLQEYVQVLKAMGSNRMLMMIFGVYIVFNFQVQLQNTYLSIYLVKALHIHAALIAIFPAVSSIAMLGLLFWVIPRFVEEKANTYIIWGFALAILANVILITQPKGQLALVIVSTILSAAGGFIASPYLESVVQNLIEDDQRAKMFSFLQVLVLLFISPSGLIGGWAYSINPKLPFVLIILSFLVGIALLAGIVLKSKQRIQEA